MYSDKFLSLDNLEYKKFFEFLTDQAKYSKEELEMDYRSLIDRSLSQKTSSKLFFKYGDHQSLASRNSLIMDFLGSVEDLYDSKKDQQELIFDVIFLLVRSMEIVLGDFRSESSYSMELQKKNIFGSQLVNIFSQIFEKKDDPNFVAKLKEILDDEFYEKHNHRFALLIVILNNFCHEKPTKELSLMLKIIEEEIFEDNQLQKISKDFLSYLNKQIIYHFVTIKAQNQIEKIKKINPTFDKEAQVFLNYFRSFDCIVDKLKCDVEHILPEINIWAYNLYQRDLTPSQNEVSEFHKILKLNAGNDKKPLCEFLAKEISKEIFDNEGRRIKEIYSLDFIKRNFDKLSEIESESIKKIRDLEFSYIDKDKVISIVNSWKKDEFECLLANNLFKVVHDKKSPTVLSDDQERILAKEIEKICQEEFLKIKKISDLSQRKLSAEKLLLVQRVVNAGYYSTQHKTKYKISPEILEEKVFKSELKNGAVSFLINQISQSQKSTPSSASILSRSAKLNEDSKEFHK
jgi:hypothetical protein